MICANRYTITQYQYREMVTLHSMVGYEPSMVLDLSINSVGPAGIEPAPLVLQTNARTSYAKAPISLPILSINKQTLCFYIALYVFTQLSFVSHDTIHLLTGVTSQMLKNPRLKKVQNL